MYKKIIVSMALDHGFGPRALELARKLKSEDGKITAIHVFEPLRNPVSLYVPKEYLEKVRQSSIKEINSRIGDEKDVEGVVLKGSSGLVVTDYAKEVGADFIIVGSHKPGVKDYLLGSTAARIVRHAHCAVHVLR